MALQNLAHSSTRMSATTAQGRPAPTKAAAHPLRARRGGGVELTEESRPEARDADRAAREATAAEDRGGAHDGGGAERLRQELVLYHPVLDTGNERLLRVPARPVAGHLLDRRREVRPLGGEQDGIGRASAPSPLRPPRPAPGGRGRCPPAR